MRADQRRSLAAVSALFALRAGAETNPIERSADYIAFSQSNREERRRMAREAKAQAKWAAKRNIKQEGKSHDQ